MRNLKSKNSEKPVTLQKTVCISRQRDKNKSNDNIKGDKENEEGTQQQERKDRRNRNE